MRGRVLWLGGWMCAVPATAWAGDAAPPSDASRVTPAGAAAVEAPRVAKARAAREAAIRAAFAASGVAYPAPALLLRAHKAEGELELWASSGEGPLVRVRAWPICASSGTLGPKVREGDLQVPEGVYTVDALNPWSSYHLSLHVSYPNAADRARGARARVTNLGGDIMVHGRCVTIGCIPIEDTPIEELYLAVHDARRVHGARARVDVHIFPSRLDEAGLARLAALRPAYALLAFWRDELAPVWRAFEETRRVPAVRVDEGGRYVVGAPLTP